MSLEAEAYIQVLFVQARVVDMPRTVPSQIDHYCSKHFQPENSSNVAQLQSKVGAIAGFLDLYYDIPHELINLPADDYATLVANVAAIELAMDRYRGGKLYDELEPIVRALPVAWNLIKKLPDRFPAPSSELAFITDAVLQQSIGLDINSVAIDLQSGEWKGATVLAASCCEALLLFGLQERIRKSPTAVATAVSALRWKGKPPNAADPTDGSWNLYCYTEVAYQMGLISKNTKSELDPARDYRNLIHPAKAVRQKATCDRGTAYVAAGAMDHVVSDLKKNI